MIRKHRHTAHRRTAYWRTARWPVIALMALILAQLPLPTASIPAVHAAPLNQGQEIIGDEELVYIGSEDEKIRVLDTNQIDRNPLIQWESPDGDWRAFDLGDFNNDGDMEIVAIKGGGTRSGEVGLLAVFDPVVIDGTPGLPEINGVPWRLLHERLIPGRPTLVKAGNFDPNIPGDEIVYGFLINEDVPVDDEDDKYRFTIIKAADPQPNGIHWVDHISAKDEGQEWDFITAGDMGDGGADEIVLIEEDGGELNVFKIESGWQRIFRVGNDDNPFRWAEIGDFYQGGYNEMLTSRKAGSSLASMIFFLFTPGSPDGLNFHAGLENEENVQPYPRVIVAADVNGSGDDEAFLLRRERGPRLFSRNAGPDPIPALALDLDGDDGYRAMAGGDFDADGREEIAILRNDNLRIFSLEDSTWSEANFTVAADTDYLRAGDLDAAGFSAGPRFALRDIDPPLIEATLEPNRESPTVAYDLINDGSPDLLSFSWEVTGSPPWVTVSLDKTSASEESPARIFVAFDSTGLIPGTYSANLVINGTNPDIVNNPFLIPIELTVEPARIQPSPDMLPFIYFPCAENLTEVREQRITLNGTQGVTYNAAIIERPVLDEVNAALAGPILDVTFDEQGRAQFRDGVGNEVTVVVPAQPEVTAGAANIDWPGTLTWVSASSQTGVIPDVITVRVDPNTLTETYHEAVLVIVGDETAGNNPTNVRLITISTLCASGQNFLPYLRR